MRSKYWSIVPTAIFSTFLFNRYWVSCDCAANLQVQNDQLRNRIKFLELELEKLHSNVEICNVRLESVINHTKGKGNISNNSEYTSSCIETTNSYLYKIFRNLKIVYKTPFMILRNRYPSYSELESLFGYIFLSLLPKFLLDKLKFILWLISKLITFIAIIIDKTIIKLFKKCCTALNLHLSDSLKKFYRISHLNTLYICKDLHRLSGRCFNTKYNFFTSPTNFQSICPEFVSYNYNFDGFTHKILQTAITAKDHLNWIRYTWNELLHAKWRLFSMLLDILIEYIIYFTISLMFMTFFYINCSIKFISHVLSDQTNLIQLFYIVVIWLKNFYIVQLLMHFGKKIVLHNLFRWFERMLDDFFQIALIANPEFALIAPEYLFDRIVFIAVFVLISFNAISYSVKGIRALYKLVCNVLTGKISLFHNKPLLKLKYRNVHRQKFHSS